MRVSGDNEDRVRLRWMSREQEESKRRQKRGRHTQCEHIHAYTHTDKAQLKLMRSERNTQTQSQPYWRHLPIVYPRLRSLHRGPRRWELVVLFSWTSDVVVLTQVVKICLRTDSGWAVLQNLERRYPPIGTSSSVWEETAQETCRTESSNHIEQGCKRMDRVRVTVYLFVLLKAFIDSI